MNDVYLYTDINGFYMTENSDDNCKYSTYLLLNEILEPLYVGYTCRDLLTRLMEHQDKQFFYEMKYIYQFCLDNKEEAKQKEQMLICETDPKYNKKGKKQC